MPRNRDYKKEYRDFHAKPSQKKRRAARNKARADAVKSGRVKKGDGSKEVHHKDGNPKNHSKGNEVVVSKTYNRKKQARGPAKRKKK